MSVPDPVPGSVPAVFTGVDEPAFLLDYRSVPTETRLGAWLDEERDHHYVAGTVDPDDPRSFHRSYVPAEAFDGTVFVRDAGPTTPL